MEQVKPTIGVIGAGVTGTALACLLSQQGYSIVAVYSRSHSSSNRLARMVKGCHVCNLPQEISDLAQAVFITTPDDIIADVAQKLEWHKDQIVIHCSGVHSTDILEPAHRFGASVCCLHPLQTFASIEEAIHNIGGSTFALEGDQQIMDIAGDIARAMNGNIIFLKAGDKVLYHAAAVTLSNYLVTLMKTAADFWQSFGIPQDQAVKALLPLLKGTVNNIERVGIPNCLTGPIARGDVETVRKHIIALEKTHPASIDAYRVLGIKTLSIALAKGRISLETADEIRSLLAKSDTVETEQEEAVFRQFGVDFASSFLASTMDKYQTQ
ncbi:MAG: DUF2520 domain-containing protein [Dehalococcoidia bacterium]|nr:DUF2520 domain-containing protein [Dehalococcoidia bacterium]